MSFKYHNINPNGYHIPDCVPRAISTAMNIDYYGVLSMLHKNGKYYSCDELCVCCYEKLLDHDFNLPHFKSKNKTVQEIANDFINNILIIRIDGHLTCAMYGNIYDIWNCSDKIATDFWIVNKNASM